MFFLILQHKVLLVASCFILEFSVLVCRIFLYFLLSVHTCVSLVVRPFSISSLVFGCFQVIIVFPDVLSVPSVPPCQLLLCAVAAVHPVIAQV